MEISETKDNLGGFVFSAAALAADLDAYQCDQRDCGADFSVTAFVRKRFVGNGYDGIAVRSVRMVRHGLARSAPCVF